MVKYLLLFFSTLYLLSFIFALKYLSKDPLMSEYYDNPEEQPRMEVTEKETDKKCPNCGATVISHRICPECGYYHGRQIIEKSAE